MKKEYSSNPIAGMGNALLRFSLKYMPDASIFAALLTVIAFVAAIALTEQGPVQMLGNWYKGFWELLAFSMQMCLIVVTGSVVASAPVLKRGIRKIAELPSTGRRAVWLVTFVSIAVSYIHWGLSLIVGALLAKEVARSLRRRGLPFEYGLIAAGGYVGQMTWQGALSSSIGLSIASEGHFLQEQLGIIPMADYTGNLVNIFTLIGLIVVTPVVAMLMHPADIAVSPLEPDALRAIEEQDTDALVRPEHPTVGERLNYSCTVAYILGGLGLCTVAYRFITNGFSALDINMVNFIFFFGGLLLHRNMANYIHAVTDAVKGVTGIIFQFPLYAGIQGIIKYSGLVAILSNAIVKISTTATFYLWTFLAASIINMFVPSGGGQWTVQGPIAVESARMMGADVIKTSLMVGYGNAWTNMAQPFWAIALLGITGLKVKDVIGYSTAIMLCSGVVYLIACFLPM